MDLQQCPRPNCVVLYGHTQTRRFGDRELLPEGAYWLVWAQISGIGSVLIRRLQQHFGTLEAAWKANPAQLAEVEGFGLRTLKKFVEQRSRLHPQQLFSKNPYPWI